MNFDQHERRSWAGRAQQYQLSHAALCAHPAPELVAAVGGAEGRLLDVGSGTGTVAALAGEQGAEVTAVDAEPSMLAVARSLLPTGTPVCGAALPELPFADDSFDAVAGNFVLNHVGVPGAALTELRRVARPGGRIGVTVWPSPAPPLQALCAEAVRAAGIEPGPGPRLDPEHDFPRTEDGLGDLLAGAGLGDVKVRTIAWQHRADPKKWWRGTAGGIGVVGALIAAQPVTVIADIKRQYDRLAAEYVDSDGLLAAPTAALLAAGCA